MMRFALVGFVMSTLALTTLGCDRTCEDAGRTFGDGDVWTCSDGCNTCSCNDGDTTSTLVACAGTPGPAAGKLVCKSAGQTYRHGESLACDQACGACTCEDGDIVADCADDAADGG